MGRKSSAVILDASVLQALVVDDAVGARLRRYTRWLVPALAYREALEALATEGYGSAESPEFFDAVGVDVVPLDKDAVIGIETIREELARRGADPLESALAAVLVAGEQFGCGIMTCRAEFAARFGMLAERLGTRIELVERAAGPRQAD